MTQNSNDITVAVLAQRLIASAKPDTVESRIYPKSLVEICEMLIKGGVTAQTTADQLHTKLLRLRTLYLRHFLIDEYSPSKNLLKLQAIEFLDGKIVLPTPPPRGRESIWW